VVPRAGGRGRRSARRAGLGPDAGRRGSRNPARTGQQRRTGFLPRPERPPARDAGPSAIRADADRDPGGRSSHARCPSREASKQAGRSSMAYSAGAPSGADTNGVRAASSRARAAEWLASEAEAWANAQTKLSMQALMGRESSGGQARSATQELSPPDRPTQGTGPPAWRRACGSCGQIAPRDPPRPLRVPYPTSPRVARPTPGRRNLPRMPITSNHPGTPICP
jgi:hypothetical protein